MEFLVGRDAFMVIHARGAAENGLVAYRLFRACRGGVCGGISVAFPVRIFFVRVQIFRWSIVVFVCLWTDKKQKRVGYVRVNLSFILHFHVCVWGRGVGGIRRKPQKRDSFIDDCANDGRVNLFNQKTV